jgi:hypothetical protein
MANGDQFTLFINGQQVVTPLMRLLKDAGSYGMLISARNTPFHNLSQEFKYWNLP